MCDNSDDDLSFESHPEYARLDERYRRVSIRDLSALVNEMFASARHGIAQFKREFNGNGGRRYGPAMATESGREEAQEARLVKLYLEERIDKCLLIGRICEACEEETSEDYKYLQALLTEERSREQEEQEAQEEQELTELNVWQVTQSVDGSAGAVSWRVFRYVMSELKEGPKMVDRGHASEGLLSYRCNGRYGRILIGAKTDAEAWTEAKRSTRDMEVLLNGVWLSVKSETRTREYAKSEETGAITEFAARSDAQAHCDTLNGYAYVADDSGDIKVRQRERVKVRDRSANNKRQLRERALIRPRNEKMTPEALAALLADD